MKSRKGMKLGEGSVPHRGCGLFSVGCVEEVMVSTVSTCLTKGGRNEHIAPHGEQLMSNGSEASTPGSEDVMRTGKAYGGLKRLSRIWHQRLIGDQAAISSFMREILY